MARWTNPQEVVFSTDVAEDFREEAITLPPDVLPAVAEPADAEPVRISLEEERLSFYAEARPVTLPYYAVCKRALDISASVFLFIILSPFILLISLLIVLDSPGAPIFRQLRKGKHQAPFYIYKFRTMDKEACRHQGKFMGKNEADGILFKLKNDPRTTRIGRFLRVYSIDELPQLFNVLRGDMSLVGPRPFSLDDFGRSTAKGALFQRWLIERHRVQPGITGLWQISGRSDIPFQKLMELDLEYVKRWNPVIDVIILAKTIGVVLGRKGAY